MSVGVALQAPRTQYQPASQSSVGVLSPGELQYLPGSHGVQSSTTCWPGLDENQKLKSDNKHLEAEATGLHCLRTV